MIGYGLVLTGILAVAGTAAAGASQPDYAALCRSVDDGTACDRLRHGLAEPAYGLSWRRLPETATWSAATSACAQTLGAGWRLPTLAELDQALDRVAFGYCDVSAWTATAGADGRAAWHRGVAYEGQPRCTVDADGHRACVGGCGPLWMARDEAPVERRLDVVCVRAP